MHTIKVIRDSFNTINENKHILTKSLIIPILLTIIIELVGLYQNSLLFHVIINIINALIFVFIAITVHRIIILGPESISTYGLYKPTSREISYAIHIFGLFIIIIPLMFLAFLLPHDIVFIVIPLVTAIYTYFASRLSLVFPGIAVDGGWSFSDSWNATENYKGLMFGVVIVFPIIINIVYFLFSYLINSTIIYLVFTALGAIVMVSTLSSAYLHIKSLEEKAS